MTALDRLIAAVEAGKPCVVPSTNPHCTGETMRIIGYAEGYCMARHRGAAPFVVSVREVLNRLEACRTSQGETGND